MFTFIANLKPYLIGGGTGARRFAGYLLSADYYSDFSDLAGGVLRQGRVLVADNGNFNEISALIKRFEPQLAPAHADRVRAERGLKRYARRGDLPLPLRDRFRAAATEVARASRGVADDARARLMVPTQTAMVPTYLIGMEDFTIAALSGLGIEPEYTGLPLSWYRRSTERALEFALRTRSGEFGPMQSSLVFAGLHGIDYDTAKQAGRLAGVAGVDGIACGFSGALADRKSIDFRVQDRKTEELGATVPRPYLRVADIAAGLHVGFAEATGRRPRFHALGVGSPILIPLLALLGDNDTFTAVDSTAPILDAYSSQTISLYVDRPAPLKLKAHKIAEHWLAGGRGWDCRCPYCFRFNAAHPPELPRARVWWASEGRRSLGPSDMRDPSPLAAFLPLLSGTGDAVLRREAGLARVWHNHWIVRRLEHQVRRHATSPELLRDWVGKVVAAYGASHGADKEWKAGVAAAWRVADAAAVTLADADSGGEL